MRAILTKDSQAYRVLALVALSGECAEEALTLLLPQESYRQKVLRRLLEERLLSKYQKDGVKGYRLMRKGKETLLQLEWERFSFYLADGADFSMRRAGLTQRQRQHCISEILAIMERAEILMDRSKKQPIFENIPMQSGELSQDAFFHPKEVKAQADFTRKIISSKMTGVLLSQAEVWLCYNMQAAVPKWFETVENRADILIQSILRSKQLCFNGTNALLFGRGMQQAVQCLEDAKMRVTILNAPFQRFCFIPLDENGILLLKLMYDAEAYQSLLAVLAEDLQQKEGQPFIIQDGYNQNGQPALICVDCDLKRLIQFQTQFSYLGVQGEVICFDFQKEAIEKYCGEQTKISTVNLETVRKNFLADK